MPKRLVLCCDGTWNTPDQRRDGRAVPTNVVKVALAVAPADADGREQRTFYHRGVGTDDGERIRGGLFGFGLSRDVRAVYRFLVQEFEPGDELFFFGFSRGAFTARSTIGFIRNCGILRREHADRIDDAYRLYRSQADRTRPRGTEAELFRQSFAHSTPVRFVGVWDTVGALGIPLTGGRLVNLLNRRWQFHDTRLTSHVEAAFQALAIDERRAPYQPAIWQAPDPADDQRLEQVWFAGTHSDIGGGNPDPTLSEIPLRWMTDRARSCGLEFRPGAFQAADSDPLGTLHESRRGLFRLVPSHTRPLAHVDREHESVSPSAVDRYLRDPAYAPPNLVAYFQFTRRGRHPAPSATNDKAVARWTGSSDAERRAS